MVGSHENIFKGRGVGTQYTISNIFNNLREEASQEISLLFYNNVIPFNVTKIEEFDKKLELVVQHGLGFKPSSYMD